MANSSPLLKAVLGLLIAGCLWLSASSVAEALAGRFLPLAVSAVLWGPLACGLWRRHPLARRVALGLLWLIVLVLPVGLINPFAAMDGAVTGPASALAVRVYGLVAVALGMIHVLGRHKAAFSRHDAA